MNVCFVQVQMQMQLISALKSKWLTMENALSFEEEHLIILKRCSADVGIESVKLWPDIQLRVLHVM
jgi:hypothetical protein